MIEIILKEYRELIEKKFEELLPLKDYPYRKVLEAARYSLLLGGKRIRPIIVAEFCKLLGGKKEDALNFAIALEMIHTYSLIHDDLPCMDNDDMRRGKPSCHKAFGEDIALLAGDTLLTEAFNIVSISDLPNDRIVKAVNYLATLSGLHGMIGGQVLDLEFEKSNPDFSALLDMYSRKTSGLLIAAATLGCIAAGKTDDDTLKYANEYGRDLGLAFQIIDDILDCTADEKILGKPVGSDEKNCKTTFVTLLGLEKAKVYAKQFTDSALNSLDMFDGDKTVLKELTEYLLKRNY